MFRFLLILILILAFTAPILANSIEELEQAISRTPGNIKARKQLAVSYYEAGDMEHAVIQLESLSQLAPRDADVIQNLMSAYLMLSLKLQAQKEYSEALRFAQKSIKLARAYEIPTIRGQYQKVIILAELGDTDKALEGMRLLPADTESYMNAQDLVVASLLNRARASVQQKDYEEALEYIAKASQVDPEQYSYLHLQTVHILTSIGHITKALGVLVPLSRVLPYDNDLFQYRIGSLYRELGERGEAMDYLSRIPEGSPYYERAQALLNKMSRVSELLEGVRESLSARDADGAIVKLRELLEVDSDQHSLRLTLSKLLLQKGDQQGSLAELELLSMSRRVVGDPFYQLKLGELYNSLDQKDRSARLLRKVPEKASQYKDAQDLLKQMYLPVEPDQTSTEPTTKDPSQGETDTTTSDLPPTRIDPVVDPVVDPVIDPVVDPVQVEDFPPAPSLRAAQSLLEQGSETEAISELDRLVADPTIQTGDRMEYEIGVLYMQLENSENAEKHLKNVSEGSLFYQAARALLGQLLPEKPAVEESSTTSNVEPQIAHPLHPIEKRIRDIVARHRIEASLALALMKQESSLRIHAVSGAGAAGLCQIMPATGRELGLKIPRYKKGKKPDVDPKKDERFEPYKCMDAGFKYLRQLLNRYDDNVPLALSAYNAGMGRTKSRVARISETTAYVSDVMTYYWRFQDEALLGQAIGILIANIQAK